MKFSAAITSVISLALTSTLVSAGQVPTQIAYDPTYDDASLSLTKVACSDGANGLITKYHYQTLGNLPKFPYVAASSQVAGWNSPQCSRCFGLTVGKNVIFVAAVDHAGPVSPSTGAAFNIGKTAFDILSDGQGTAPGRLQGTFVPVKASRCGF